MLAGTDEQEEPAFKSLALTRGWRAWYIIELPVNCKASAHQHQMLTQKARLADRYPSRNLCSDKATEVARPTFLAKTGRLVPHYLCPL